MVTAENCTPQHTHSVDMGRHLVSNTISIFCSVMMVTDQFDKSYLLIRAESDCRCHYYYCLFIVPGSTVHFIHQWHKQTHIPIYGSICQSCVSDELAFLFNFCVCSDGQIGKSKSCRLERPILNFHRTLRNLIHRIEIGKDSINMANSQTN